MRSNPSRISEDDHLRSRAMRHLVQESRSPEFPTDSESIPKVIVQYWHDLCSLPGDVRDCLHSWDPLERQGFKRVLFDDDMAGRFISMSFGRAYRAAFDKCHHPAMRCDYFRLCYVLLNGGMYVDADEVYQGRDCEYLTRDSRLKVQPLCYDTATDSMIPTQVFVKQQAFSPTWIYYVNNNPLIAPAYHPILRFALGRSTRILLAGAPVPFDIQSTTGPGNLTASLVRHSISPRAGKARDFSLLTGWEDTSISRWPLSYRDDERNWRLWNPDLKPRAMPNDISLGPTSSGSSTTRQRSNL